MFRLFMSLILLHSILFATIEDEIHVKKESRQKQGTYEDFTQTQIEQIRSALKHKEKSVSRLQSIQLRSVQNELEKLLGLWKITSYFEDTEYFNYFTLTDVMTADDGTYIAVGTDSELGYEQGNQIICFYQTYAITEDYMCASVFEEDDFNWYFFDMTQNGKIEGSYTIATLEEVDAFYAQGNVVPLMGTQVGCPIDGCVASSEDILHSNLGALKSTLLQTKSYSISGSFAPYDFVGVDSAFDWTFVTPSNDVYQLQGNTPTSNDVFGWKKVAVTPKAASWYMSYLGDWDSDGSGKYDWVLVGNGFDAVYKLEGVSDTGNFSYSEKIDLPYQVSSDKKTVLFGTSSGTLPSNAAEENIGPGGGLVEVPGSDILIGGTTLSVPSGAIDTEVTFTVKAQEEGAFASTPKEAALEDGAFYFSLVELAFSELESKKMHPIYGPISIISSSQFTGPDIFLGPDGQHFNKAVILTVPLNKLAISVSDTTAMPMLKSANGSWSIVSDFAFDVNKGIVTVEIPHFSILKMVKNFLFLLPVAALTQENIDHAYAALPKTDETVKQFINEAVCSNKNLFTVDGSKVTGLLSILESLYTGTYPGTDTTKINTLKTWVKSQDGVVSSNSISLGKLFGKALEQNNGDLFSALAAANGVLSQDRVDCAKAIYKDHYLCKLMENYRGDGEDESGARYHFFGTALYTFAYEHFLEKVNAARESGELVIGIEALNPTIVSTLEEGVVSGDLITDPTEYAVDLKGAELGRALFRQLRGKTRDEIISQYNIDESSCADNGVWMVDESVKGQSMTWDAAKQYCLNKGGRLPSVFELQQAWIDGGRKIRPDLQGTYLSDYSAYYTEGFTQWLYWADSEKDNWADTFFFAGGIPSGQLKTTGAFVRCRH